ncbi:MAG TPA: DUF58 domain-containing protein [Caulobacteraceae bacterium]|jgi:uncharacterized protein (DUF58 family)
MIYPTRRAIVLSAAGAPAALAAGLIAPDWWAAAGGWIALILSLTLIDALLGPAGGEAQVDLAAPDRIGIAGAGEARVSVTFDRSAPPRVTLAVETNERLMAAPERLQLMGGAGAVRLTPVRRGQGEITALWLRWTGPFGLVWKQRRETVRRAIAVTPNVDAVRSEAVRLFSRQALAGVKVQLDIGEGADFHALRELTGATDSRAIDWKQSARHLKLLGKEFRVEANHPIVFAIDGGRQMCEPLDGVARLDLAVNAALLAAFVSLRLGDRAALFGFDSRPRLYTGLMAGVTAFERLRRLSASLDYGPEETNYTFGLTELAGRLKRRSFVVIFTDFSDTATAELMIENIGRLVRRHLVLFVVFRDAELEAIAEREPKTADDISRAVTAAALLRGRDLVIERLRRLGVHVLDTPPNRIGPALVTAYLEHRSGL